RRGRGAPPARKRLRAGRGRGPLLRAVHLPEPPQPAGDERAAAPLGAGRRPARTGARAAEPGEPPGRRGVEGAGGEVTSPPATRYFVDVLSSALNTRRACVPAIVSLTAIRSQAPLSTSSNVRDGYGSTL